MRLAIKRLARATTIAAAIVASSGSLTARLLFANLGEVALKLTAGLSEVEAVRRKITKASAQRCWLNNLTFASACSVTINARLFPSRGLSNNYTPASSRDR